MATPVSWVRFMLDGATGFGTLDDATITVHDGDMFGAARPSGRRVALADVKLLTPTAPTKIVALWNNFLALAQKQNLPDPAEPLYFLKAPNSWLNPGEPIRHPGGDAKVVFEGELGIVIGKRCTKVAPQDALAHVFGYTVANDVTAVDVLSRDASFAQWTRAKGFDTFCPFGPTVTTGLDPRTLAVRTTLNGQLRQDYPISDMRFPVETLVSAISQDMSLLPGDIILCGTSVGVGSMKPGSTVEVAVAGIGTLRNEFL